MNASKWLRVMLASSAAAGIVAAGGGVASAVMTDPPVCQQSENGGCLGGPGAGGGGIGDIGRTFLTGDDVEYIGDGTMTAVYDAAQWDSYFDFVMATEIYWNLHKPYSGCWIDVQDPNGGSASNACTSSTYDTQTNADGTQTVTFHHH